MLGEVLEYRRLSGGRLQGPGPPPSYHPIAEEGGRGQGGFFLGYTRFREGDFCELHQSTTHPPRQNQTNDFWKKPTEAVTGDVTLTALLLPRLLCQSSNQGFHLYSFWHRR